MVPAGDIPRQLLGLSIIKPTTDRSLTGWRFRHCRLRRFGFGNKIAARFYKSGCTAEFYFEINGNWFQGSLRRSGFDLGHIVDYPDHCAGVSVWYRSVPFHQIL